MKLIPALVLSLLVHALLAEGAGWWLTRARQPKVLMSLDVSSVELSFAEDEREAPAAVVEPMPSAEPSREAPKPPRPEVEPPTPEALDPQGAVEIPRLPEVVDPSVPRELTTQPEKSPTQSASAAPSAAASAAPRQARIDAPPRPSQAIRPDYPRAARRRGEQGEVVLEIRVTDEGRVESVAIATSSGYPALDTAALKAVKSARFIPAKSGEAAVASTARLTLKFRLK